MKTKGALKVGVALCILCVGTVSAQQDLKPDLVITDIWPDGTRIYFQVMNIGEKYTSGDFKIEISVDGNFIEAFPVDETLKPDQRITDYFRKAEFNCSNVLGRQILAIADSQDEIDESNEKNNNRSEYFSCDNDPPVITEGPSVDFGSTSLQITWKTDEYSDSKVLYGTGSGVFDLSEHLTAMIIDHSVTLAGLLPGTTYHYKVQSTDPCGNTFISAVHYLTTPPPGDTQNPKGSVMTHVLGRYPMHFNVDATDDQEVDRVEFELDGQVIWIDYEPPFQCILNPEFLGMIHQDFFGNDHQIQATIYDLAGNGFMSNFDWTEIPRCPEISLWHSSSGPFYVTTPDPTHPNVEIRLNIHAKERNEGIVEIQPDPYNPRAPRNTDSVWDAVQEVRIYFDGALQDTLYPDDPDDDYYVYYLNTGVMDAPSEHTIRIEAVGNMSGCTEIEDLGMNVGRIQPRMFVRRNIDRDAAGNYFHVNVEIENAGTLPVTLSRFVERITGLQAVFTNNPGNAGTLTYDVFNRQSVMEFAFNDYMEPDDTLTFSYDAVPVMYEGVDDYQIGDEAEITFEDNYGRMYELDTVPHVNHTDSGRRVDLEVIDAFKASDYLMITNPVNLFGGYDNDGCNLLLVKMAELAIERNGVLGFFNGQVHMHSQYDGNDKLKVGNLYGDYRDEIVLADDPNRIRIYNGVYEQGTTFRYETLSTKDALLVGNVTTGSDGYEPIDEIVVVKGDNAGPGDRGDYRIYRYDHADNRFEEYRTGHIPFNPDQGDQLLIGDMIVTTPNPDSEIILFNQDGRILGYYESGGTAQDAFDSVYQPGDPVAVGDLLPAVGDEIIIGDASEDEVVIYNGDDETVHLRFDCNISTNDHIMVCAEGLAIADESADRIDIYRITETSATKTGGFPRTIASDDTVRCGYFLNDRKQQYLFARGSRHDNYSKHDMEILAYSVYDGMEEPGDRHDLDALINPGGQWADKMTDGWTSDGYLLIVGEIEIIPSFARSYYLYGYGGRHYIEFTDNYYSNTSGDMKFPELSIGRIIGNCPFKMADKIQRCIDIARGDQLLDTSSAYVVSGSDEDDDDNRFDDKRRDRITQLRNRGYTTVNGADQVDDATFFAGCIDRDVIYLTGHGNYWVWDDKDSWDIENLWDPGSGAPLVYGDTCLTGRYFESSNGYAEHWMEFGASAYIGSTEVTYSTYSKLLSEGFFDRYGPGYPLGLAMKNAKRNRMGDNNSKGKYHSAVYHVFGDPKMEPVAAALKSNDIPAPPADLGQELDGPIDTAYLKIPPFQESWFEGNVNITIPGGTGFMEYNRPKLPAWPVTIHFPAGYRIEDVTISEIGGTSLGTGLPLPFLEMEIDDGSEIPDPPAPYMSEWPDRLLDWDVQKNPDGSSDLLIKVYPFKTWPETTNYTYFTNCKLEIDHHTSSVSINKLVTDKKVYSLGDTINADLYIYRPKQILQKRLDVIAEAKITGLDFKNYSVGLPIKHLADVRSLGTCSWKWDTLIANAPAGDYELHVELKNALSGKILDFETVDFRLGTASGVTGSIIVDPPCFRRKQDVDITCRFKNSGQSVLSGRLILEILDRNGSSINEFSHAFDNLSPGQIASFSPKSWTAVENREQIIFRSYTMYDGRQSNVVTWPPISPVTDGDLNNDFVIDFADFAEIAQYWLTNDTTYDIAPLGGDCSIDMTDIMVIINDWSKHQ